MKKFFVSAGLVAISAAALESAMADDVSSPAGPKYWSVGATLRGFYDDNYSISSKDKGSFGVEFLPTVSAHVPLQQTDMGIRYTYGLYYYQARNDISDNPFDQTHQVDLWIDHAFNERWDGKVTDTFALGQEPELLQPNPSGAIATPYRVNGNNWANHGNALLTTEWTRLLTTQISYQNGLYHYQNSGAMVIGAYPTGFITTGNVGGPSLAGLLNRDEHDIALNLEWTLQPETVILAGYEFDLYDYTGDEPIAMTAPLPGFSGIYHSGDRNTMAHKIYLGIQETFTPNLQANVNVGASYDDPYNNPVDSNGNWTPYANASLTYTYLPGSYVQLGVSQDISATDQVNPDSSGHITEYAKDSVVYVDINHRITEKLIAGVIGRLQYSTYEGGAVGSDDTEDWGLGVNLTYQFTPHFSADAGYNYDNVNSNISGYSYTRNRVYLGLTANY